NVVSLPSSLTAEAYSLSHESAPSLMGLGYFEIKPPWTRAYDLKIKYTFLALHYLSKEIARKYDIQSHDIGLGAGFTPAERDHVGVSTSYNSVMLGPMGSSKEFMRPPSLSIDWSHVRGPLDAPTADFSVGGKVGFLRPRAAALTTATDTTANSYAL